MIGYSPKGNPRMLAVRLLLLTVFLSAVLFAQQNTATILGTVTDPSGSSIANAKITATGEQTGFARSAETDATGAYLIPLLPIGSNYRLTAEAAGFKVFSLTGLELQLN